MYKLVKVHTRLRGKLEQEKHKEASLSSLQRASQLATNCLALTSRTFLSTNEAGGRRAYTLTRKLQCEVCVFLKDRKWRDRVEI